MTGPEFDFASKIREIPDFPKPGILFKDITPLLQDPQAFKAVIDAFARRFGPEEINTIVGVESRGFVFGAPLAYALGVSFVPVRKFGKLPAKTQTVAYSLEYGQERIQIHEDAVAKGDRVIIVDDLLATGGTAAAAGTLVERLGGTLVSYAFVIELTFLKGRERLGNREVFTLVKY